MAKQKTAQTSKLAQRQTPTPDADPAHASMRLDKWLWCARFYKTRALATEDAAKGRISVNDVPAKAGREIRVGDLLAIGQGMRQRVVRVQGLSATRGPATVAQTLYEETPESQQARQQWAQMQKLAPEPADMLRHGRPTKKDRRELEHLRTRWEGATTTRPRRPLDERWSAVYDRDDAT